MLARSFTATLLGVEGSIVTVEADARMGLPGLTIVGQAVGAVAEARERVRSALAHCGHELRPRKQVVNLAPADLRKDSPGIDLAVAAALLGSHEVIPTSRLERMLFWGELSLDGALRPAAGTLIVADAARRNGYDRIAVAAQSADEACLIPGLQVYGVESLPQLVAHLRGDRTMEVHTRPSVAIGPGPTVPDMADVVGLSMARLAVEVMVAGGHNLLLHGPPGVGKTMLARRAAGLFPPLDTPEALEVTKIHGLGRFAASNGLMQYAPVRTPHHTVSAAGLLGGGVPVRPGEVSLAHRGLLFLDELPEFPRSCLEGLREPLEDGHVTIARASGVVRFPARFQLMAAMNPCPCGFLGHPERNCVDPPTAVARYRRRLSGPLLDRIDLVVPVVPTSTDSFEAPKPVESSDDIRRRIAAARARARLRLAGTPWRTNAEIPAEGGAMETLCPLDGQARARLIDLAKIRRLSPRAQHRLRRVALTLADLQAEPGHPPGPLGIESICAAASLRCLPD